MHVKQGKRAHRRLNVKRIKNINWKAILIALLVTGLAWLAWSHLQTKTLEAQTKHQLELKQVELQKKLQELDKTKANSQELQKQLEQVKKDLEAKRAKQAQDKAYAESLPVTHVEPVRAVVAGCGDNQYAQYIYSHESGCNLNAVNSIGCRGIGQACPGSKLPCGADYACQNAFFTNYAIGRYGSWANAMAFWQANHWW